MDIGKEPLCKKLYEIEINTYLKSQQLKEIPEEIYLGYRYQVGGVVEFVCSWVINADKMDVDTAAKLHAKLNTPIANRINKMIGFGPDMYII